MAECSICGSTFPDTARYCANCGNALREATRPSAFEVGRIAALDTMKSEIFKWLALPAAVVTVIAGIGGYLGVTNIINTEVQTRVRNEIDREIDKNSAHLTNLVNEMHKKYVDVAQEQGAVRALQQDSKKLLDTEKQELVDLEENKTKLAASINSASEQEKRLEEQEKRLEETIVKMKLRPLLMKLQYDFEHVRDFGLSALIGLDPPIDHALMEFPHAEYVMLLGDPQARLDRDSASAIEDSKGIRGVNIKFALALAEERKILNRKIGILSQLTGARLVFYSEHQYKDKLALYTKSIKTIHLSVLINKRPLWQLDLSKPDLNMADSSEGNNLIFFSNLQLENYGDSLVSKYEDLFTDKESQ
jgi:hypothetical protein